MQQIPVDPPLGSVDDELSDFVRQRAPALMRYGFLLTGSEADAADLLQDALIGLRGAWWRIRRRDALDAYVRRSMARRHIAIWRRRRRETLVAVLPESAAADDGFAHVHTDDTVWQALSEIGRRQRAVLVLRFYEQLTDEEIADVLGITRNTVRSQAARGLERLRERLTPQMSEVRK